jgi:hypothetical protein
MTTQVPKEGLKVIAIIGYIEGKPIWREVGMLKPTSTGNLQIHLLRYFNPAGVPDEEDGIHVRLQCREFSSEELDKKNSYKTTNKHEKQNKPPKKYDDFEDDIPF